MGKIVESGDLRTIFRRPLHPYTVGLLQSVPKMGRDVKRCLVPIPGSVPDPFSIPQGCAFRPRCPAPKEDACAGPEDVPLIEVEPGHKVRCCLYLKEGTRYGAVSKTDGQSRCHIPGAI